MSRHTTRLFVLIQNTVGSPQPRPYVARILPSSAEVQKIYFEYVKDQNTYLSKWQVERLGVWPDTGPRYTLLPFDFKHSIFIS